jgi:hypothetical protein
VKALSKDLTPSPEGTLLAAVVAVVEVDDELLLLQAAIKPAIESRATPTPHRRMRLTFRTLSMVL